MAERKKPTKPTAKKGERTRRDWASAFLTALSHAANISEACRVAKIGRDAIYERRKKDAAFLAAMRNAIDEAIGHLELEMWRRAIEGTDKPVFHQGEQCGAIREYSDTLAIFLAKAHRPKKYRERFDVKYKHSGVATLRITEVIVNASDSTDTAPPDGQPSS